MKVLFIHQNFPGQFIHLSAELAKDPAHRVVALGMNERPVPAAVELRLYGLLRQSAPETHPLLLEQEAHVLRAEACASAAFQLKHEGFEPDIIIAHPGWGEALFIKDVFPNAKLIIYCEYYYALEGQDVGFDPKDPPLNFQQKARLRLKNTTNLLSLQIADAAVSPTHWQKSTYPGWAQEKIHVIHDGIDVKQLRFNPNARLALKNDENLLHFRPGDEVLSYVARNLEPVRGFPMLMEALPPVLARRPNAHAIIVGGEEVSYGARPPDGTNWKSYILKEMGASLDMKRVHFVGKVPYSVYRDLLSVSKVHAYWTTPFVLSWSALEATAIGLPLVASNTPPVAEFAGALGWVTPSFFDTNAFAEALSERLEHDHRGLPPASIDEFSIDKCVQQLLQLIRSMLS